ncbi:hypothetical protein N8920_00990 [Opitutales bacterium]|nr:hypothetical protein [Opitutales bacterium]MDA8991257.1 hypothetical protein [Opitutales bacterium]
MSQYDFDGSNEGDWDDAGDLAWNESDWQVFLRNSDKEVVRFMTAYNKVKDQDDRLDAAANLMGWQRDDWSSTDEIEFDENDMPLIKPVDIEEINSMDPYTIHRHPIYITSSALFSYLRASWEQLMRKNKQSNDTDLAWGYSVSLSDAEKHCIMAANSLDLGDFLLAVCHFKKAHSALNESMRINRLFTHNSNKKLKVYQEETNRCMYDLREIWLRVMSDCRK